MIDIESEVFDYVAKGIRAVYPSAFVVGEYTETPAKFPAVTIVEADNRVFEQMRTTRIENAVTVMYQAEVYSNKASGKKLEAKAIATTMDSLFTELGFTRTFREQIPNLKDATIYRIVCRYEGIVGEANESGKYLIYQNNT